MKKLIAFTLVLTLLFSLAACGGEAVPSGGSDTESASTAPAPDEASPENVDAPADAPNDTAASDTGLPFAPNPDLADVISISIDKDTYAPGEDVTFTYTIHTLEAFSNGIAVGIYDPQRENHEAMRNWGAIGDEIRAEFDRGLSVPDEHGDYEVRVYAVNGKTEDGTEESLVAVLPFTVSGDAIEEETESASDTSGQTVPDSSVPDESDWAGTYINDFATISIYQDDTRYVIDIIKNGEVVGMDYLNIGELPDPDGQEMQTIGGHDDPWKSKWEYTVLELSEDYQTLTLSVLYTINDPEGKYHTDDFLGAYTRQ